MDILSKYIASGSGIMVGFFTLLYRGQNKKISELDKKKTDKDLCKTIHSNIDKTNIEIKNDIADIKKIAIQHSVDLGKFETMLGGIKEAVERK